MKKVLGMGNALVDVLASIDNDNILITLGLPKGSMQLIDEAKLEIISKEMDKLNPEIVSGGSAANTIVGLAQLGVDTGFIGKIGKDQFGNHFKRDMHKYNITSYLTEVDEPSGVASTFFIAKDGERTFGTYLGAAALLDAGSLNPEDFKGYEYFYIEGYLVQNYELIKRAIILAKEAGSEVILDMASYNIVEASRDFLLDIIPQYVDIVFANEDEAKALYNMEAEEAVSQLAEIVDIAIVKTGAKGSWIQQGNNKIFIPARKVNCADSTGAGDLYASGFIFGLINNFPLETCGEMGTLLASEVIQSVGAKIPDSKWDRLRDEITSY
ncbi:adenosine kinase [Dysgonomonas sp. 511]|uniref:adenosine kinase n=1 Tax=Dysgonomonas sp. 511 TaxID=2302930 RepID=UPI0013D5494C|nr:adenosine kinase [Dysgonomonas sp. 511]NDV78881.1 adenosine kinase [Dysgonomonas sp. 511]